MGTVDTEQARASYETLCGWCGQLLGYSSVRESRGICGSCYPRVIPVPELTPGQAEKIPVGLLQLDARGRVLDHENLRQYGSVVGRNFFTAVVPFTRVRGFQGRYQDFLASGDSGLVFDLTFRVDQNKEIQVHIFFGRICAEIALVRIKLKV